MLATRSPRGRFANLPDFKQPALGSGYGSCFDAKGALTVLELGRFRADPNARIELASSIVTPVEHIDGDNGRGACRGSVGKQLAELTRRALIAIGARGE